MRLPLGLSAIFAIILPTTLSAQAPAGPRAAEQPPATLASSVSAVIDAGAILYNNGDALGCFRVYQGALMAYAPTLETSPETKRKVEAFLKESQDARGIEDKTNALRHALEALWNAAKPVPPEKAPAPEMTGVVPPPALTRPGKPLWDRLGGAPAIKAVVTELVNQILADPAVDFTRKGKYPLDAVSRANFETLLAQYISEAAGGPTKYAGRSMAETHKSMAITDAQFNAMLSHLVAILKEKNIAKRDLNEFVSLLNATRREIVEAKSVGTAPQPGSPAPVAAAPAATKPLWDRLGGEAVVKGMVHDWLELSLKNPNVDFTRGGKHLISPAELVKTERRFVEFFSATTGGPLKYEGKSMTLAHQGMAITENQYASMTEDLVLVMSNRKISQELIDELISTLPPTFEAIVEKK